MRRALTIASFFALALTVGCVVPNPGVERQTSKGPALTDANQMTLYTFDNDTPGKSVCNGPCATAWPPLHAYSNDAGAGDWSIVARADNTYQWAYKGKPVYIWSGDKKPGDATGDGFRNVWHIAKP